MLRRNSSLVPTSALSQVEHLRYSRPEKPGRYHGMRCGHSILVQILGRMLFLLPFVLLISSFSFQEKEQLKTWSREALTEAIPSAPTNTSAFAVVPSWNVICTPSSSLTAAATSFFFKCIVSRGICFNSACWRCPL